VNVAMRTSDGLSLEAEWRDAQGSAHAVAVLCHPHPQYGGTMRSIVTSALFDALPAQGVACLRFNFRGVEGSEGEHGGGHDEPLDVVAAIDAATTQVDAPLVLIGWSFGADVALTVDDARVRAYVAIAPPLRFRAAAEYERVGADARAKLLVLAAHDEFRPPAEIEDEVAGWNATRVEIVAGASHFFVGRTDRVVALAGDFLGAVTR
jgi:alpha/beta superfamily hydrolase